MRYTAHLLNSDADQRRGGLRIFLRRLSTLRAAVGPADVLIENVSTGGCMLVSDRAIPDDDLTIGLRSIGTREVTVKWRDGDRIGCAFVEPLTSQELARVRLVEDSVVTLR